MNALWNAQQREWLQALGHDALLMASGPAAPGGHAATTSSALAVASARGTAGNHATDTPLMRAVVRAAGRREVSEFATWLPEPASLRGNAAAKRALWPRLRALRRTPDA